MKRFFERVKTQGEAPPIASFGNMMTFYSLLFFLLAIPFVLIVGLVWITGVIGFSAWITAAFLGLAGFFSWRIYRCWQKLKSRLAAQSSEVSDIVKEAAKSGKDIEVTLLNGLLSFRYQGGRYPAPLQLGAPPLALEGPANLDLEAMAAVAVEESLGSPGKLRQEIEGFLRLRDSGVISPEEFETIKGRLLQRFAERSPVPELDQPAG
ncbi:SHOCT domain-containing protein [Desulfobacca acetoxidans]|uniref:SHOCT domain-containing protein n=1 Tax=Desulfobacca acetoxidans (strain ATCC 700848 / DSM 11109 / ASRB2) TaxID=880072 RepID=F2NBV1_DESAR|nr:SHOCT domain-containing protein [Desulfobacca acetoxidans]AEB08028.1 hypothetical protein Desac_0131 [Desulfobacca acetoxidans DSM 11109]HAY20672.1 SHOCT domain-containing protein [Desulfobacterales bacterium]